MSRLALPQLISNLTNFCENFQPILEEDRGKLAVLQQAPTSLSLEDAWSLRGEVKRRKQEMIEALAKASGKMDWSSAHLEKRLQEYPELFRRVDAVCNGFSEILEAISGCERELIGPYFVNLCGRLEPALGQFDGKLLEIKATSVIPLEDVRELQGKLRESNDELKEAVAKASHYSWVAGGGGRVWKALEKRLERYPEVFVRVNKLWSAFCRIENEVDALKRSIRNAESRGQRPLRASTTASEPTARAARAARYTK
jgi:hypothetical protein